MFISWNTIQQEKEQTTGTGNNLDESPEDDAERKKPTRKVINSMCTAFLK